MHFSWRKICIFIQMSLKCALGGPLDNYMMTSSNEYIFRVTGLCAGNSPVPGEFSAQRPVTRSFDVFFDLHLNKQLSKQSRGWWFETPSGSLWRQCNVIITNSGRCNGNTVPRCIYALLGHWVTMKDVFQSNFSKTTKISCQIFLPLHWMTKLKSSLRCDDGFDVSF